MIALCATLLSSCSSTSDPVARLGLAPQAGSALAVADADELAAAGAEQPYYIVADDDPELPEIASAVPTLQNRPEPAPAGATQLAAAAPLPVSDAPAPERFAPGQQPPVAQSAAQPVAQPVAQSLAQSAAAAVAAVQPAETGSAFAPPQQQKKRTGFFSSLFAAQPQPETRPREVQPTRRAFAAAAAPAPAARQTLAITGPARQPVAAAAAGQLPGVRENGLFEISRRNGTDDDDIDIYEEDEGPGPVQLASAAGLARLAPNGLLTQTDRVDVACLKPSLVRVLKQIESRYGKKVVVTSGYRSPPANRRARGARNSLHMYCAAADIQVEGVTRFELASFVRSMPGRGGVGTYCHTESVHVDVGPERDWNWRCRRKKRR